jgi:hypothetical protein
MDAESAGDETNERRESLVQLSALPFLLRALGVQASCRIRKYTHYANAGSHAEEAEEAEKSGDFSGSSPLPLLPLRARFFADSVVPCKGGAFQQVKVLPEELMVHLRSYGRMAMIRSAGGWLEWGGFAASSTKLATASPGRPLRR